MAVSWNVTIFKIPSNPNHPGIFPAESGKGNPEEEEMWGCWCWGAPPEGGQSPSEDVGDVVLQEGRGSRNQG